MTTIKKLHKFGSKIHNYKHIKKGCTSYINKEKCTKIKIRGTKKSYLTTTEDTNERDNKKYEVIKFGQLHIQKLLGELTYVIHLLHTSIKKLK